MNDEPNKTFERLYDDEPEKNKRSFFDWLSGKEESEEEKLRKKFDKELKNAARKRAEIAEEEARVAERREQPETRKLKKRWRKRLYKKSQQQLAEAPKSEEPALDGYELAQYMVAERIVRLYTALKEEDLRKSERKALKIQIDFMGLLSEKLSRPEIEVPEEVETLWRTIVTTSQPSTSGASDGEASLKPSQNNERPTTSATRTPEKDVATPEAPSLVAAVVAAIRRVTSSDHNDRTPTMDSAAARPARVDSSPPLSTRPLQENRPVGPPAREPVPHWQAPEQPRAVTTPNTTPYTRTPLANVLDRVALQAGVVSPVAPQQTRTIDRAVPSTNKLPYAEQRKTETVAQPEQLPYSRAQTEPVRSEPKLEELSTAELLAKARPISLDAGRYLAYAYTAGEIDRAGLIKVLKAHAKGLDYRSEFRRRHESYKRQHETSPERLTQSVSKDNAVTFDRSIIAAESEHEALGETSSAPPKHTTPPLAELQKRADETAAKLKKQANIWLLVTSIALVLILGAIIAVVVTL